MDFEGELKSLITDENGVYINPKGKDQFKITSYHRFIAPTNNDEAMNTSDDDRRKCMVAYSNELIGNKK